MMSNTPRVFVGATTLLIAGMTSGAALHTVTAAMNDFPGVRVTAAVESPDWLRSAPTGRSIVRT
jgi:hypothetical protein